MRRPARFARGAFFVACCIPAAVAAQSTDFVLPAGSILPNYDRVSIGQMEALEANAYVARTNDAGANWYNPAGLVQSAKTALNASGNAYEITRFSIEGLQDSKASTRYTALGTFFGGVVGAPILSTDRARLGFSYTRPVSWTPSPIEGEIRASPGGAEEKFLYSSYSTFVSDIPAIAVGFSTDEHVRFGVGVGDAITTMHQEGAISDRLIDPTSSTTLLQSLQIDATEHDVIVTGGVQVDVGERLMVGAVVASPGMHVTGSSRITYQKSLFTPTSSRDGSFRDDEAKFEYKIPFRFTVGVATRLGKGQVEADLKYHGAQDSYTMFSSSVPADFVTTDAAGVPTTTPLRFAPVVERVRSVYNVSIGGRYPLRDNLGLHAGFFTDTSPVDDEAQSLFRKVDLLGASTGVSFVAGPLTGALGVSGSWGTSEDRQVGPTLGGAQALTQITVRTFNLIYALAYSF